ncbi:MAG: thiamine pyrophosphate-binding protein, partial [Lachnospiraceae bacterium]
RLANAVGEFAEFVNKYRIPVTYSRLGHDLIETDNDLSIGMVGMLGASRAGNFAIQNSDLILCIGCRLSIDTTGYEYEKFARAAKIVVIDIDEVEHMKETVKIDYFFKTDAKIFINKMLEEVQKLDIDEWRQKCLHWKEIFPTCLEEYGKSEKINMYYFTQELSKVLPEKATVVSDAGNTFFTVSPVIRLKEGQRSITSGCQAEMGYALPAAIGISFASENVVVAVNGDGSVMMNLQELETLKYTDRNVKVFIMNNNGYSSIRHLQNNAFRGRQIGCDPTSGISFTNFELLAKAFGIDYLKVEGSDNLAEKLSKVFENNKPLICEVMCVEEQPFIGVAGAINSKKRYVNRPLEDQAPWIDREVFLKEMIIEPIDQ